MTARDERPTLFACSNRDRRPQSDPGNRFLQPFDTLAVERAKAVADDDVGPIDNAIMQATARCSCCSLQHIISYRHVSFSAPFPDRRWFGAGKNRGGARCSASVSRCL